MDIHPFSVVGGIVGGLFGVYMANSMYAGAFMKIVVFICVALACFFVVNLIANKD